MGSTRFRLSNILDRLNLWRGFAAEFIFWGPFVDIPIIRDPFGEDRYVAQATAHGVNKGDAAMRFAEYKGGGGPIIAAGDDRNDLPMLQTADLAIVMGSAP